MKKVLNDEGVPSKNQDKLSSFVEYCLEHPELRFWQALRNWSKKAFILKANDYNLETGEYKQISDTFFD